MRFTACGQEEISPTPLEPLEKWIQDVKQMTVIGQYNFVCQFLITNAYINMLQFKLFFLAPIVGFLSIFANESLLISYYKGKVNLSETEISTLIDQTLNHKTSHYLVSYATFLKAIRLRKSGKDYEAYETYEEAMKFLKKSDTVDHYLNFSINRNQGVILREHGLYLRAFEKHEKALPSAYQFSLKSAMSVRYNMGWCLSIVEPQRALEIFYDVLREASAANLSNRQAKTHNEIGNIFIRLEEFNRARNHFEQAVEFSENDKTLAQSYHNLGGVFYYLRDYKKQESFLLKSLSLRSNEDRFPSLRDLGECYVKQNNFEKAKTVLAEAESYYDMYPLSIINIQVIEWLATSENQPNDGRRKPIDEKKKLEAHLKQQAMQQLLLRLEAEKHSKNQVTLYKLLSVAGAASAIIILFTWRIWWYRMRRNLGRKIMEVVGRWEEEDLNR